MNCDETKALLPECLEGALPEVKRRQAEAHLSGCSSCKAALAEAGNLDKFLAGAIRVPDRDSEFWAKQEARLLQAAGRQAGSTSERRRIPAYLWGIGVAATLLVTLGIYVVSRPSTPAEPPKKEVANEASPPNKTERQRSAPGFNEKAFEARLEQPVKSPANEPDPRPFAFPRETRPEDPVPTPVLPQETAVSALLPGDPDHLDRLTDENIEVGLAESSSDRVIGLIKAADGRLSELRAAIGAKRETMAEDLATAYTMICRQGISAVLADRTEDSRDLAAARAVVKTYAGWKVETLARLEPDARGSLKAAIHDALLATRELAGQ